jgi:hypothetical protein
MAGNPFQNQVDETFRGQQVRAQTETAVYRGWLQIREYSSGSVLLIDAERDDGTVVGDVVLHDVRTIERETADRSIEPVPVDALHPAPYTQRSFESADFREFVRTVRSRGHLLSFPLARPRDDDHYEIVSGHRRCEAARRAGLDRLPVEIVALDSWDATVRFLDEHVPTSRDEAAAAVTDPYSGFYEQPQLEALLDALREDWSPSQLRDHAALAWYLDTDDVYPDEQSGPTDSDKPAQPNEARNGEKTTTDAESDPDTG